MKNRLPSYFRQELPDNSVLALSNLLSDYGVHTVCKEAKCPNISSCFKGRQLTFMILGNICTRNCKFCNVTKNNIGENLREVLASPQRISRIVKALGLKFVVITSVTRDDLTDGGVGVFVQTIESIHKKHPNVKIEVLIPDFKGCVDSLKKILDAGCDVVAHNIETVKRLYFDLRPMADYNRSQGILSKIKEIRPEVITKSSLMLGLGEKELEVIETMKDLRQNHCDCLTLGQYLAPSPKHYPVKEFIGLDQFLKYRRIALGLGFKGVISGPKVRSSYKAMELYNEFSYA